MTHSVDGEWQEHLVINCKTIIEMIQKKRIRGFILGICIIVPCASQAQVSVTYNHDDAKMNQITVMEVGAGGLTPTLYYDVFHNSYQKSASEKNKLSYRTLAGVAAYQQIDYAENIDSALTKRAKVEALNMADRSGGALDLAWAAEGSKINSKLQDYQNNINRIVSAGGNFSDKERWETYYNMFQCAIRATQEAYMPNSQRKKQYLQIYSDICKQNETLVSYIVQLNNKKKTAELLSATSVRNDRNGEFATAAHNRWREAGYSAVRNSNNNQGGATGDDGGTPIVTPQ